MTRQGHAIRSAVGAAALALGVGWQCSPGPGRDPDTNFIRDAGTIDAHVASPPDATTERADASVPIADAEVRHTFPFSGVFGVLNSSAPLYAREVGGTLSLIVGAFPYAYAGTISESGEVDASSREWIAAGCSEARVTGAYDRNSATYSLVHDTCNARGEALTSRIVGGFARDFDPRRSGVYDVVARVIYDASQCSPGGTSHLRFAVNVLGIDIAILAADDLVPGEALYIGTLDGDAVAASQTLELGANPTRIALRGVFTQVAVSDPVVFSGQRWVFDPANACTFQIAFQGQRTEAP